MPRSTSSKAPSSTAACSHLHDEFIRFLKAVEAVVPPGKLVHVVLDNYATHKHPEIRACLARYIAEHNRSAKPFTWTKSAAAILDAVSRVPIPSV